MPYPHNNNDRQQPETSKSKIAAFWPVGQSEKAFVGREVETPDGRKRLTKAALIEAIQALDLNETNGLELLIIKNVNRDDDRFPLFNLFVAEARPKQAGGAKSGGGRLSAPRPAQSSVEDDDIPF